MITHAASRKHYTVLLDRPERRALFREGFRSEPRIFVCAAHKNTLSPRKVYFAMYTPPRNMIGLYSRLSGRELCETFAAPGKTIGLSLGLRFVFREK